MNMASPNHRFRHPRATELQRRIFAWLVVLATGAGCAAGEPSRAASRTRLARELITVAITSPNPITPLYINQQQAYSAVATCKDQFSDDGGVTWQDVGADTSSPVPTIVWSAAWGTFLTYCGGSTIYQAPDGSLVDSEMFDSITASAVTVGNDIYGAPPTIQPEPMPAPDDALPHPGATSQPATSPVDFAAELSAARAALDRDGRVAHLRRALALRPGNPLNIQIEFRIGNMLCFNPDTMHHEPVRPMEALGIFEGIMSRYDHKTYYEPNPAGASDDPQLMVPRSAILAASILLLPRPHATTQPDDGLNVKTYLESAMADLQWTYSHRREDWLKAPKPIDLPPGVEPSIGWYARRVALWEYRKNEATAGNAKEVLGVDGMTLIATAVRLYGTAVVGQHPEKLPSAMKALIHDFPNTLIAAEAQHQLDQAPPMSGPESGRPGAPAKL
jgi:hypothetical protein